MQTHLISCCQRIMYYFLYAVISVLCINYPPNLAEQPFFTVQHLPTTGGLYFQKRADAYMHSTFWEVVTYFDVTFFQAKLEFAHERFAEFNHVCELYNSKSVACGLATRAVRKILADLTQSHGELLSAMRSHRKRRRRRRRRRSIFTSGSTIWVRPIVSTGGPAFTADYYDEWIDGRHNHTDTTEGDDRIMMSIIRANHTGLDQSNEEMQRVRDQLNTHFQLVKTKASNDSLLMSELLYYFNDVGHIAMSTRDQFGLLAKVMFYEKRDVLANGLLPADLFVAEMRPIIEREAGDAQHKPQFPLPVDRANAEKLIDLAQFFAFYSETRIIFVFQVPVVTDLFSVYRMLPLPRHHGQGTSSVFSVVLPTMPYFARSETEYALMRNLKGCQAIEEDGAEGSKLVCENHLVYDIGDDSAPICEMETINPEKGGGSCRSTSFEGDLALLQPIGPKQWLFTTNRAHWNMAIQCTNVNASVGLSGIGILTISAECYLNASVLYNNESYFSLAGDYYANKTSAMLSQAGNIDQLIVNKVDFMEQTLHSFVLEVTEGLATHRYRNVGLGVAAISGSLIQIMGLMLGLFFVYITWQLFATLRLFGKRNN